jgi:cytochrome c553
MYLLAPAAIARPAAVFRRSIRALAGQHADYAEAQLVAFRAAARNNNATMVSIAAKMNDREIKAVADYIAGLR